MFTDLETSKLIIIIIILLGLFIVSLTMVLDYLFSKSLDELNTKQEIKQNKKEN